MACPCHRTTPQPQPTLSLAVDIDPDSGFCFGVTTAINRAERELGGSGPLYCLGDIVHNSAEIERLAAKGLRTVTHSDLDSLPSGSRLLLRAHGEPPSTYAAAERLHINLVDATCPVVLRLQQRIKADYDNSLRTRSPLQIVIYGQTGHAEVNGLVGQTDGSAIVIETPRQAAALIRPHIPVALYSQTTMPLEGFRDVIQAIRAAIHPDIPFRHYDTVCRQVSGRVDSLRRFASTHHVVLFVAGTKSSNGRVLYNHCLGCNPRTYMVDGPDAVKPQWLHTDTSGPLSVGICGATSTPRWLMEQVALRLKSLSD